MTVRRSIQIVAVGILAILTVVAVVYAVRSGGKDESKPTSAALATPPPARSSVAPPLVRMLVLGDSAAAGQGASSTGRDWVQLVARDIGWQLANVSVQGSGYLSRTSGQGTCVKPRCPALAAVLARTHTVVPPDVVVVAAGRDDDDSATGTEVGVAARAFLRVLHRTYPDATIVVVNPGYDAPSTTSTVAADDAVQSAAKAAGATYADVGRPIADNVERLAADGTEPNDAGHRAIARAVLAQLRDLPVAG